MVSITKTLVWLFQNYSCFSFSLFVLGERRKEKERRSSRVWWRVRVFFKLKLLMVSRNICFSKMFEQSRSPTLDPLLYQEYHKKNTITSGIKITIENNTSRVKMSKFLFFLFQDREEQLCPLPLGVVLLTLLFFVALLSHPPYAPLALCQRRRLRREGSTALVVDR